MSTSPRNAPCVNCFTHPIDLQARRSARRRTDRVRKASPPTGKIRPDSTRGRAAAGAGDKAAIGVDQLRRVPGRPHSPDQTDRRTRLKRGSPPIRSEVHRWTMLNARLTAPQLDGSLIHKRTLGGAPSMRMRLRSFLFGLCGLLAGCSLHPLPEDVVDVPTHAIVRKIRCEARDAIIRNLLSYLAYKSKDPRDKVTAASLGTPALPWNAFSDALFRDHTLELVNKFENAAIAYDFVFDITEIDNIDPTLDITGIFHHGSTPAAIGGGVDRTRQSTRNFTLTDTFIKLVRDTDPRYCDPQYFGPPKELYPITGSIGLDKTINQFINLTLFDNLTGSVNDKGERGPPTMVDKLVFTTKLSLSATPKIILAPIGMGFHLLDASLGLTASRNDAHTVTVALALPKPAANPAPSQPASGRSPVVPSVLSAAALQIPGTGITSLLFVNATGTPAEILAAQALNQSILRFEVGKTTGAAIIPVP